MKGPSEGKSTGSSSNRRCPLPGGCVNASRYSSHLATCNAKLSQTKPSKANHRDIFCEPNTAARVCSTVIKHRETAVWWPRTLPSESLETLRPVDINTPPQRNAPLAATPQIPCGGNSASWGEESTAQKTKREGGGQGSCRSLQNQNHPDGCALTRSEEPPRKDRRAHVLRRKQDLSTSLQIQCKSCWTQGPFKHIDFFPG